MGKKISLDYIDDILSALIHGNSSGASIYERRNLAQKIQFDRDDYCDAIASGNDRRIDECSQRIQERTSIALSFLGKIFGR
jgi:hypothetical protein